MPSKRGLKKKPVRKAKKPLTIKDLASRIDFEAFERHADIANLEERVEKSFKRDTLSDDVAALKTTCSKMENRISMAENWISVNEGLFSNIRKQLRLLTSSLSSLFD